MGAPAPGEAVSPERRGAKRVRKSDAHTQPTPPQPLTLATRRAHVCSLPRPQAESKKGPCALARPPALSVKEHECSTRTAFRPEGCCGRSGKLVWRGDSKRLAELPFSDFTAYQLPEQKRSGRPALPLKRDTATGPALLRRLLSDPRQGLLRDGRRRPNLGWKGGNGEVGGCLFSATEEQ